MRPVLRNFARRACALLATAVLAAACSDSTSPEPDDFEGAWDYVISNAQAEGVSCDVDGITVTFSRTGGVLAGVVSAGGDDNINCQVDGAPWSTSIVGSTALLDVAESGNSVEFTFDALAGPWVNTGTIADHQMSGTVTLVLQLDAHGPTEMTGSWAATRQ